MDFQRSRVYKWENEHIHSDDYTFSTLQEAQDFVDFVFYNEGKNHPPRVVKARPNSKKSTGTRTQITLHKNHFKASVLLHEMAHAMLTGVRVQNDDNVDCGAFDGHGPKFMAKYVYLLEKYMRFNLLWLIYTCKKYNVKIENYN